MTTETARVYFLPRFLRRRPDPGEAGMRELEAQYQIYQILLPLSGEARERVIKHNMQIFASQGSYHFEE